MLNIHPLTAVQWHQFEKDVLALEALAFSKAQCHKAEFYLNVLNTERHCSYIAMIEDELVGFLFSGPLELFETTAGVKEDNYFGKGQALYTADMVVNPNFRKRGIGKALKQQQISDAKDLGYRIIAGRNRLKYADAMWRINEALGAKEIQRLTGIYKDGREPNACIYHHLTL